MRFVFSPGHERHDPQFFLVRGVARRSTERPERAARLHAAALRAGLVETPAAGLGRGPAAAVHTPDYLDFLASAHEAWQALGDAAPEIVPNVHPARAHAHYPRSIVGRAGWHMADTACPIGAGTWSAACAAADVAATAAQLVLDGDREAYALCRPPGHHAYADMAGGFCFLNNTAIAAQHLRRAHDRVAILDVDVHHGNGTQGIFYERGDVLTVSVHADPADFYPFFWGHVAERGAGPGTGYNMNLPLALGTGDDGVAAAVEQGLDRIAAFAPGALVVALGLDAYEHDPLRALAVTTPGFARIGAAVGRVDLPVLLVQEGGYLSDALGANLESFLSGFRSAR